MPCVSLVSLSNWLEIQQPSALEMNQPIEQKWGAGWKWGIYSTGRSLLSVVEFQFSSTVQLLQLQTISASFPNAGLKNVKPVSPTFHSSTADALAPCEFDWNFVASLWYPSMICSKSVSKWGNEQQIVVFASMLKILANLSP